MIELINATFAAGEQKDFVIAGGRFEVIDALFPVDVFLLDASGAQLSVMRSAEASFFSVPKGGFKHIQIKSSQAQTVRFLVGSGDAGTRRAAGTVSLVAGTSVTSQDYAKVARPLAGAAYSAYLIANNAGAAPKVQLWNPVGSGKTLLVTGLLIQTSAIDGVKLMAGTLQYGTANPNAPQPKLIGGAASVALARYDNSGAVGDGPLLWTRTIPAATWVDWGITEPFVIPPGAGLNVNANGLTGICEAVYQFYEV
jgi:hypothetical protein